MTFSKQTLIKHFVSATEMGTLSLKNSLPCLCDRQAKLCTIWQRRLHEEPRRKAPYTYSSCLHFLALATSRGFFLSLTSITFSHFSSPPSESSPSGCRSHPWWPVTNAESPVFTQRHRQQKQTVFNLPSETSISHKSLFGGNHPDRWPIKSASHPRSAKWIKVCSPLHSFSRPIPLW